MCDKIINAEYACAVVVWALHAICWESLTVTLSDGSSGQLIREVLYSGSVSHQSRRPREDPGTP